ncbi:hypothetical protein [Luteimonas sp. 3794]|uniref:hypothetical protein n=1 Tax=Luteimonas sp. 3794 TaxID=2817730 RepID=UPI0028585B08|nr:hypothetical protein [Luteimonas sp. 3794]MDR6993089.1 acyl-coenzyme A thioesterase PaaI-like protein [Luteimonas sp. 3794]
MHRRLPPACLLDMQGRFIVAALDNTLGPFSCLIAPPSVTATLNTQSPRPVASDTPHIICEARLVARTRNVLHLAAEERSEEGNVFGLCQATQQMLPPRSA